MFTQCKVCYVEDYRNPSFGLFPQVTGFLGWKISSIPLMASM